MQSGASRRLERVSAWRARTLAAIALLVICCLVMLDALAGLIFGVSVGGALGVSVRFSATISIPVMAGAMAALFAASVRQQRQMLHGVCCPVCAGAMRPGEKSCAGCWRAWDVATARAHLARRDVAWKHAMLHALRHPLVLVALACIGAFVLHAIVGTTTGWKPLFAIGAEPIWIARVVMVVMLVGNFAYVASMLRISQRIQDERLCPKCLYPLGSEGTRCPECGREWSAEGVA